ncbi:TerD family protein [Selenomonas sputigena]|uniref:TerD family protein n=1 Tax=Selenomonas sputigena TaxID=69823 RepID=UPI0028E44B45|nr:TerD family protein [Selenomonas sputigena]
MEREQARGESAMSTADGSLAALPKFIDLGAFAPECENSFAVAASPETKVRVTAEIADARVSPEVLPAGAGGFLLTLPTMRAGSVVYGALTMRSASEERRIFIAGEARAGAPERRARSPEPPLPQLVRGERLRLAGSEKLAFRYEDEGREPGVEVDAYVFRLYAGGRVHGDEDLIFFGNARADDDSIEVNTADDVGASVDVAKVGAAVERLVLCFSVYDDGTGRDFSHVRAPRLTLAEDGVPKYSFHLDGLRREKTVNAAEIYRHRGAWKLKLVGAGYEAGLARLCEDYGLSVE